MPTREGQIVGVTDRQGGWTRVEIDVGQQRSLFADTKREDLIDEARQLLREGTVALFEITEREGRNINPNTQKPYIDRYYEGVRSNGSSQQETRRQEPEQRQERREPEPESVGYGYRTHPENAWRMALTSGSERAVQTLPLMPAEQRDFETQKQIALAWAVWIMNTRIPAQGFGEESASRETRASQAYEPDTPLRSEEFGF